MSQFSIYIIPSCSYGIKSALKYTSNFKTWGGLHITITPFFEKKYVPTRIIPSIDDICAEALKKHGTIWTPKTIEYKIIGGLLMIDIPSATFAKISSMLKSNGFPVKHSFHVTIGTISELSDLGIITKNRDGNIVINQKFHAALLHDFQKKWMWTIVHMDSHHKVTSWKPRSNVIQM
jgi:hypothetical protein